MLRAVDLFAGAGGFSLGLARAGFEIVLANEYSTEPEWTYRANLLADSDEGEFPLRPAELTRRSERAYRTAVRTQLLRERKDASDDFSRRMRGGDIRDVLGTRWLKRWQKRHDEVDVLVAGPPCQGFSSAGKRDPEDERNLLSNEALRVVRVLRPKVVVIENVPGMLHQHPLHVRNIGAALARCGQGSPGYSVVAEMVHAESLGVPQTRRRLLIIGVRKDIIAPGVHGRLQELLFPPKCPTVQFAAHDAGRFVSRGGSLTSQMLLGDLAQNPPVYGRPGTTRLQGYAAGHSLNELTRELRASRHTYLRGDVAGESRETRQFNYANHDASNHAPHVAERMRLLRAAAMSGPEGRANRCHSAWLRNQFIHDRPELRTAKNAQRVLLPSDWPSLTVTSLPDDIVHFRENRIPTVRELARLQTFPDWFEFNGVRTTGAERRRAGVYVPHYTQVANAVPARLANAVATRLRWFLDRADGQQLRDCDFSLPGGHYQSPNRGASRNLLQELNEELRRLSLRRTRDEARRTPDAGQTIN
jgi:DNA (cytosine-5)-methyltransferase 1